MKRPTWDFEYLPLRHGAAAVGATRFVAATPRPTTPRALADALGTGGVQARADVLFERAPLFWYGIELEDREAPARVRDVLRAAGVELRYVTPADRPSVELAPRWDASACTASTPGDWRARPSRKHEEERIPGRWFVDGATGVDADRTVCGTGAGSRLAVIDDEARDTDALDLDETVQLVDEAPLRGSSHGAAMVAWAVGTRGSPERNLAPFAGVAPDASTRFYVIPKPDRGLPWLPLAIVRAVRDGADVVVAATYVVGMTSPLLDDALEFATRLGRGGLGTAVVMPTGREISSPPGSVHASLTLGLSEPMSDPRVLCVAPSGRDGGWFLWKDKHARWKPFADRGPAVRVAAPGDDMTFPFAANDRLGHAESSGASAIAAGVALLVLSRNPGLRVEELYDVLGRTATPCETPTTGRSVDPFDLLPAGRDADGHDARCGYGRLCAARACLAVADPVTSILIDLGEDLAARRHAADRTVSGAASEAYTEAFARWSATALGRDAIAGHAARALLRHLRLLAGREARWSAHAPGAMTRLLALTLERLVCLEPPPPVRAETEALARFVRRATESGSATRSLEASLLALAGRLWASLPGAETNGPSGP